METLYYRTDNGEYREAPADLVCAMAIEAARPQRGMVIRGPVDAGQIARHLLYSREHEVFLMITLDSDSRVIASHELFRGTLDHAAVHPREVVKTVLADNAKRVFIAHNHPDGRAGASEPDLDMTRRLAAAMETVEVQLVDHLIVGQADGKVFSTRASQIVDVAS